MQDETQKDPGADHARETSAPDPSAANPVEAEELNNQDTVAPDSAAASTQTDQGGSAFDPSVAMRGQDLANPASPTDQDPAASADLSDPALHNMGVADPWGSTSPSGLIEQAGAGEVAEAPAADPWGGEVADAPAADPWGDAAPPRTVEQEEGPPLLDEPGLDEPSATERVEPPGSGAAPIEGDTSSPLIGGGGAVGEASGPGETIEDAGEAILDPPEAADIPQAFWRPPGITAQEPNNMPDPWAGTPSPETVEQASGGEVADAPAADPWAGTPSPETAPTEGDASPTEDVFDHLAKVDHLQKEHSAALDSVRETARTAGEAAKETAEDLGEAVEAGIGDVGEALENYVEDIPVVGDALGDAIGDATDVAQDALKGVGDVAYEDVYWNTFAKEWTVQVGPISEALKEAREDLGEAVEAGIDDVGEALENYVEDIPVVGDALEDVVDDAF